MNTHLKFIFFLLVLFTLIGSYGHSQEEKPEINPKDSIYFGPIIKLETVAFAYYMPQFLTSIEYYVHPRISLQQSLGVIVNNEDLYLKNLTFDDYKGFGAIAELRYHHQNKAWEYKPGNPFVNEDVQYSKYLALEFRYTYSSITTPDKTYYRCSEKDCTPFPFTQTGGTFYRQWMGIAPKIGFHLVFLQKYSLDINAGVGVRVINVKNAQYVPIGADLDYNIFEGVDITRVDLGPMPYLTVGVSIGFDFRGIE